MPLYQNSQKSQYSTLVKLFLLLGIFCLVAINSGFAQQNRLVPSGINSKFDFDISQPFEAYIEYSKNIIERGRVDLNHKTREQIIEWNSPFIRKAGARCAGFKKGIVLTHGLSDSPYTIRALADFFHGQCFTVYSILLTGHGTRPGDLLKVDYHDWIKQLDYAVTQLSPKVDKLYLGGFSTGAALAVNYVLSGPSQQVEALVLLSPALALSLGARVGLSLDKFAMQAFGINPNYIHVYDDEDYVKYESFAWNAGLQVYALTLDIQQKLKKSNKALKNTRVFSALTYEDKTIDAKTSLDLLIQNTSPNERRLIVYHEDKLPDNVIDKKNVVPVSSAVPSEKVLDLAHISLPNLPDDVWYGLRGGYRNCLHYYNTSNYKQCKTSADVYFGEITKENLQKGLLVRATFNPFLGDLFLRLEGFLGSKK